MDQFRRFRTPRFLPCFHRFRRSRSHLPPHLQRRPGRRPVRRLLRPHRLHPSAIFPNSRRGARPALPIAPKSKSDVANLQGVPCAERGLLRRRAETRVDRLRAERPRRHARWGYSVNGARRSCFHGVFRRRRDRHPAADVFVRRTMTTALRSLRTRAMLSSKLRHGARRRRSSGGHAHPGAVIASAGGKRQDASHPRGRLQHESHRDLSSPDSLDGFVHSSERHDFDNGLDPMLC